MDSSFCDEHHKWAEDPGAYMNAFHGQTGFWPGDQGHLVTIIVLCELVRQLNARTAELEKRLGHWEATVEKMADEEGFGGE